MTGPLPGRAARPAALLLGSERLLGNVGREQALPQDPRMNGTRKAGLILAGIASAMWLGALAAFLGTGPEDGVSIGGALLALLAVPVSIAAAGILLASLLDEHPDT